MSETTRLQKAINKYQKLDDELYELQQSVKLGEIKCETAIDDIKREVSKLGWFGMLDLNWDKLRKRS